KTYDDYVGNAALHRKGRSKWNRRVARVIDILRRVVNFDHLYIGGGNAKQIAFPLPPDVTTVPNSDGLTGGIALWRAETPAVAKPVAVSSKKAPRAPPSAKRRDARAARGKEPAAAAP